CSLVGSKWTHRRSTSSGSIGTPSSRHLGAAELALVRLQRVSPLTYVQSWQTPKRRCAPLAAKVVSTWCRAWCIAVRSFASSKSTARTRTSNGSRASAFFPLLVSRRLTLRAYHALSVRSVYFTLGSAVGADSPHEARNVTRYCSDLGALARKSPAKGSVGHPALRDHRASCLGSTPGRQSRPPLVLRTRAPRRRPS